ncbi:MAG: hypothetical protein ACK40T_12545 [Akkermansiaceae bacterium]
MNLITAAHNLIHALIHMETIHGAPSYSLSSGLVTLYVTKDGGHLAPVKFKIDDRIISPYALAPWLPDEIDPSLPVLLKSLRGDFLCLPFGPQADGPPHGETANAAWKFVSQDDHSLTLEIEASDVSAKITKTLSVRPGETAVYLTHHIDGLEGDWSYGTHPILDLSNLPAGSARLSVSPFRWASVYPEYFSNPADGAHQQLEIGAIFSDLSEVSLADGGTTDLSYYPSNAKSDDLVMMVSEASTPEQPFAWSACVFDGYVWFALKNPTQFPATMFWLSNGGRSAAPWNSRHTARIGIEDICSHFCDSVDVSRKDLLQNLGIPCTRNFSKDQPVTLKNIQAVAAVSRKFGKVDSIVPVSETEIQITSENGDMVTVPLDWKFVVGC